MSIHPASEIDRHKIRAAVSITDGEATDTGTVADNPTMIPKRTGAPIRNATPSA
jgi:hypothetical protein